MKKIFGFGSLINLESLKTTVPNVKKVNPCFIKGFSRDFSILDPLGFTKSNLDLKGIPFTALNVKKINELNKKVNGVCFEVDDNYFDELLIREQEYNLISTEVFDYESFKSLGECYLFSANKDNGSFDFDSLAQQRYLQICLNGAKNFGEEFYQEFLKTTFIEEKPLFELKEKLNLE